jgi:hypothetical protein
MLAGMNVVKGRVVSGKNSSRAGKDNETITMTPHVMILPLPIDPAAAGLEPAYDPDHSLSMWVMGAGTPTAHLRVHFSQRLYKALQMLPGHGAQH